MRYVRTKDGIFKVIRDDHPFYVNVEMKHTSGVMLHESVIEKSGNSIEELCDCFVDYDKEDGGYLVTPDKPVRRYGHEIYGAIWTDTGLKYVAKLGEKGKLELL